MMNRITDLWRGRLPLSRVFWTFTILFGTLVNAVATGVMLLAMTAGAPALASLILFHLLPLPYNVLAFTGVWRSAEAYDGPPLWATAAQIATAIWFALMLIL